MELNLSNTLLTDDSRLIDHIVGEVKSQGIFDQFRKECIADVDTKPAYQNLRTRVEGSVNSFLNKQVWKPDLNKNQLRETLRKHIHEAPYLDAGVERIVDQVVNPKVYSVFMSQIEDVVYKFLGIEKPKAKEKNGACGLKDLLPKDLDPVSPESDKNSLKDVSLESVDANDNLNEKHEDKEYNEQKLQNEEVYGDKNKKSNSENGHISLEDKISEEICKTLNKTDNNLNLNTSGKSDDKLEEEEEEVSPTFEPIDIMNLNECNISNDSHLSGISELTSHRSRSPDFSNELSRDNFDCSNQDSQLSKVSSDSRLSIVTDFGSSNHDLTPVHDMSRDEVTKDKSEAKGSKDNFKAIREFESFKNKTTKSSFDFAKSKDMQDYKDSKDFKNTKSISSKENSRDAMDSNIKDKYEHKSSKEKSKDGEYIKSSKSIKEKTSSKDDKYYKNKSNEKKKSSSSHSSSIKYDKHSKSKSKDKVDQINSDKAKESSENLKENANKLKDEKLKEADKKDNINKEAKDLKDLYKEKIRELREKKELTEKEKLNKEKDIKVAKDTKDRKDSPKDRKSSRKEHGSSSSSSSRNFSISHHESKSNKASEKTTDGKDKRSDSKDKTKRDERRSLKDSKGKSHYSSKSDISDRSDKSDTKKIVKSEKEDRVDAKKDVKASGEKTTNCKKDTKSHVQRSKSSERNEKLDNRKDSKNDSPSKDKKRREDKKSKTKDDHSSLRKNSNDRRSTDRDGSNGSNSKTSPSNNSNSNATNNKSGTSNLTKENHINNPSETSSDSIEEMQMSDVKSSNQLNCKLSHKISSLLKDEKYSKMEIDNADEVYNKQEKQTDMYDANLILKKKFHEDDESTSSDMKIKKPKFARNIHEAKKLMKIRKQMEKQKLKEDKKEEKKVVQEIEAGQSSVTKSSDNLENMPDDERVQIIEVRDEEYEEPYPEKHEPSLMLDERSIIMLGTESCTNDVDKHTNLKSMLSNMELCIKQSLSEIVSNTSLGKMVTQDSSIDEKVTKSADDLFQSRDTLSHVSHTEKNLRAFKELYEDEMLKNVDAVYYSQTNETHVSLKQKEAAISEKSSMNHDEKKRQLAEENVEARNHKQTNTQNDNEEIQNDNRSMTQDNNEESQDEKRIKMIPLKVDATDPSCNREGSSSPDLNEDNEDCRYFKIDNEKSERFSNFLESLKLVENSSLEDIIESLGGKVVFSLPKSMAPPLPKHKCSSPLSDILMNSDNNNYGHKRTLSSLSNEDTVNSTKKRKIFAKKQRLSSLCNPQGISNGENFVMPLSPDSDVSATSDKTGLSNMIKEEKSRNRSNQRYSSDDLYKPRPLFSSSSRRSRRSNQS